MLLRRVRWRTGARRLSLAADDTVQAVGVVGSGQMGTGIAIVASAVAKIHKVVLMDSNADSLSFSKAFVESWLAKQVAKERLTQQESRKVLSRLSFVDSLHSLADANVVIEAVKEDADVKLELFRQLDEISLNRNTILASNTSSIAISRLGGATSTPERVVGMHFMNPVPVMKLVEVIAGVATSDVVVDRVLKLAGRMGKQTSRSKDVPGFIANRLLMPYINEAVFALYEGVASRDDIDLTMKLGTNVPMGPLRLADFIGLDTCLAIMNVLHSQLGDSKYRPSPLLVNYVAAGWLGKKSGRGFYNDYDSKM